VIIYPQNQIVTLLPKRVSTLTEWQNGKKAIKNQGLIKNLPIELTDILTKKVSSFVFFPDQNIGGSLYCQCSGTLPNNLILNFRELLPKNRKEMFNPAILYVYDIKEIGIS